jgi:hypothetical protein
VLPARTIGVGGGAVGDPLREEGFNLVVNNPYGIGNIADLSRAGVPDLP